MIDDDDEESSTVLYIKDRETEDEKDVSHGILPFRGQREETKKKTARDAYETEWRETSVARLTGNGDEQEEYPRIHESAGREEAAAASA